MLVAIVLLSVGVLSISQVLTQSVSMQTIMSINDTLVVLYIPWIPTEAYPYEISPPPAGYHLVTDVINLGSTVELTFAADTTPLHYDAAFKGGVQLDRFSTIVQKLQPIVYYVEGEILYRADRFDVNGSLIGAPLAYGVKSWETKMILTRDYEWKLFPRNLAYERNR